MSVHSIRQHDKITHDEKIKNGLFYCSKCEVIISSYYPRTYSVDCLRGANHGRCKKCSNKAYTQSPEIRLTNKNNCPECGTKAENFWEKVCFEPLKKMTLRDFKDFCLKAMKNEKQDFAISEEVVEELFEELCEKDFLSLQKNRGTGIDFSQIIRAMKDRRKNISNRKEKVAASG